MKSSISTLLIASGLGIGFASADTINKTVVNAYADSNADFIVSFPAPGVPDANGWNYGYYDLTADGGTGVPTDYDYATDFTQFTTGQTRGSGFGVATSGAPWTFVQPNNAGHPNGTNNVNEHWAIRRYTVPATGVPAIVDLNWVHSVGGGATQGTTMNVYRNGNNILSNTQVASGGSGTINFTDLAPGDVIDFALTPEGNAGDRTDGSDGSVFGGSLGTTNVLTFETVAVIADSVADFSGVPGQNGWTNGYYDIGTLGGIPTAAGDFTAFATDGSTTIANGVNHWNGTAFDFGANPPWTEVNATTGHPNDAGAGGFDNEHWTTRRYEVQPGEEGDLLVEFNLTANNTGGTGTTLHLLLNGTIIESVTTNNGVDGEDGWAELLGVQAGDVIDLALSPSGVGDGLTGGADGADSSLFSGTVHLLVPEPATGSLVGISALLLAMRRRRR